MSEVTFEDRFRPDKTRFRRRLKRTVRNLRSSLFRPRPDQVRNACEGVVARRDAAVACVTGSGYSSPEMISR